MEGKYVNEHYWQMLRKVCLAVAIIGIGIAIVGISLLAKSSSIDSLKMNDPNWFDTEKQKSSMQFSGSACLMIGIFLSTSGFFMYFKRQITGAVAKGAMPVAVETINQGVAGISPAIQTVVKSIRDAKSDNSTNNANNDNANNANNANNSANDSANDSANVEKMLLEAKSLKERNIITEEEYQQMRKKILGL